MSIAWSWRHAILKSSLAATTRHVLLTVSCRMNEHGQSCYPTMATIAKDSGLSVRAVSKHIKIASKANWLEISKHGFAGQRWRNNEYVARFPELENEQEKVLLPQNKVVNEITGGVEPNDKDNMNQSPSNISINIPKSSHPNQSRNGARNGFQSAFERGANKLIEDLDNG